MKTAGEAGLGSTSELSFKGVRCERLRHPSWDAERAGGYVSESLRGKE